MADVTRRLLEQWNVYVLHVGRFCNEAQLRAARSTFYAGAAALLNATAGAPGPRARRSPRW